MRSKRNTRLRRGAVVCLLVAWVAPASILADESPAPSPTPSAPPGGAPAASASPSPVPNPNAQAAPGDSGAAASKSIPLPESAKYEDQPQLKPRVYVDEDYQVKVTAPLGWYRNDPRNYRAAGEIIRAWTPGGEPLILLYINRPQEPALPLALLDVTAKSASEGMNADIIEQEIRTVSGKKAAWLVYSGPGNGGSITGTGNILTTQHLVAVPRVTDTVVAMLAAPEKDYPTYRPVFEKFIESLEIGGRQNDAQSADE